MAYIKHEFKGGEKLYAFELNEMDNQIASNETANAELATEVGKKANQEDLTALTTVVEGKANQEQVDQLSEEIAAQATPELFGAKGDGATDDADAIAQALESSKNVVFDGDKTYAVGSTIIIPADAHVDFRGATIVPKGNHDVIRAMPGSFVENFIVRCGGISGWDSAAIVIYGGDHFRAINPTKICNVKLYCNTGSTAGTTTQGIGIKLYGDKFGDFVEGITIEEAMTYGFGIGMLFEGVADDIERPVDSMVFIGANKFRGYWSFYDNVGIKMASKYPNTHITNNIFTDLQIEPKNVPQKENQSSYGIYCQGFNNYFEGCLYDYFYYHTGVYFGSASTRNVLKTTSGAIHDIRNACWYIDRGTNNTVALLSGENNHAVPYIATKPRMDGNQDDCLAFMDKRSNCTLESFDGEPVSGKLSNVFNPDPRYTLKYKTINPDENNRRARITINCNVAIGRITDFYLQFYSSPKSVKVTFYNDKDATVVCDIDDNENTMIGISSFAKYGENYEYNVSKIVIELGGFNSITEVGAETYGEWELVRVTAVDSYRAGNTWLRRDGGEVYGNIKFTQNKGPVLTDENGKLYMLTVSTDGSLSTVEVQEEEVEAPEVAVLTPIMKAGATWYDVDLAGAAQNTITSVTFDASYESTGNEDASWACDEDGNGNIMAYRNGTDVVIKSTTGSEGVKLNVDSSNMFANDGAYANFASLSSVSGTETLRADKNTSIDRIFQKNTVITSPIFIPEGVTSMGRSFDGCSGLATPPVLPNGLVSLNTAFNGCSSLQYLPEIPGTVTNLYYAFHGCTKATGTPSEIPASVTNMTATFRNCVKIAGTIEVNAVNLGAYDQCFENASRDSSGIILTGSSPLLAELAATKNNGNVTVAT